MTTAHTVSINSTALTGTTGTTGTVPVSTALHCGYRDIRHQCGPEVRFISRYRSASDYCLNGKRLTVHDDGRVWRATREDLETLRDYFAREYSEYVAWHHVMAARYGDGWPELKADDRASLYLEVVA